MDVYHRLLSTSLILIAFNFLLALEANCQQPLLTAASTQIILVHAKNWNSSDAELCSFERLTSLDKWQKVGICIPVSIGMKGLAWGIGLHPANQPGTQLDEWDLRSPAGVFAISYAFGHVQSDNLSALKIAYQQVSSDQFCVDDPLSQYYNQIIKKTSVASADWRSAEPMQTSLDDDYKLGVVFEQNPKPAISRRGSCIFLHVGPTSGGTYGCTTLPEAELKKIIAWLDKSSAPLFIQLPDDVYQKQQIAWGLPEL